MSHNSTDEKASQTENRDAVDLLRHRPVRLSRSAQLLVRFCDYICRPAVRLYGLGIFILTFACGFIVAVATTGFYLGVVRSFVYFALLLVLSFLLARAAVRRQYRKLSVRYPEFKRERANCSVEEPGFTTAARVAAEPVPFHPA
jgi:hypothetical protein